MIAVVDYGLCNLRSVSAAVSRLGHEPLITRRSEDLARADKIILPGVGAFGDAMRNLHGQGLSGPLLRLAQEGKPLLGICLGFQLLCLSSDEFGLHEGLGLFKARVERFELKDTPLRVPHIGWNEVRHAGESPMFVGIPDGAEFYFVHSYRVPAPLEEAVHSATCEYGDTFCAAISKGNVWGTQFHPEKSQRHGLKLLENFLSQP